MSNDRRKRNLTGGGDEAAVEELLRAAQDDALLKLRVNSHTVSSDSHFSPLDHDLTRRFDALKSKPSVPSSSGSGVDDLESRFAKLKGGVGSDHGIGSMGSGGASDGGGGDEVEKVMRWAMDAARLEQSGGKCTGEDEEGQIGSSSESSEEEDDEDWKAKEKGKGKGKENGKPKAEKKRWFFQK